MTSSDVFSLLFCFAWLIALQSLGDLQATSLQVFGPGLVLDVIKTKAMVMPGGFYHFIAAAISRWVDVHPQSVNEDVDI